MSSTATTAASPMASKASGVNPVVWAAAGGAIAGGGTVAGGDTVAGGGTVAGATLCYW